MKFSIINIKDLSGPKVQIYTLKFENKYASELRTFADKFNDSHQDIIKRIFPRIFSIAHRDGIQDKFFIRESPESHHVFRLADTGKEVRLYCIMFSNIILLFGSGGLKIKGTKKNIENPHLEKVINRLMEIEDCINSYLDSKDLKITDYGFEGNLENLILKRVL